MYGLSYTALYLLSAAGTTAALAGRAVGPAGRAYGSITTDTALAGTARGPAGRAAGVVLTQRLALATQTSNLVLQSEALDLSPWTGAATVTPDTTVAPGGVTSADTLADAASSLDRKQTIAFTVDGTKVISLDIKQGTSAANRVSLFDTTTSELRGLVTVNWSGGIPSLAPNGVTVFPVQGPDAFGFFRISFAVPGVIAANTNSLSITPAFAGDSTTLIVWGVQATESAYPLRYVRTTTAVVPGLTILPTIARGAVGRARATLGLQSSLRGISRGPNGRARGALTSDLALSGKARGPSGRARGAIRLPLPPETFDGPGLPAPWDQDLNGGAAAIVAGRLRLTSGNATGEYGALVTIQGTITGDRAYINIEPPGTGAFELRFAIINFQKGYDFFLRSDGVTTTLKGYRQVGGVFTELFSLAYDPTNHRWLGLRADDNAGTGNFYLETAPASGTGPGTWTTRHSEPIATNPSFNPQNVIAALVNSYNGTADTQAFFDGFKATAGVGTTALAGKARGPVGRARASLTTDVRLAGIARGPVGRARGSISLDSALSGKARGPSGRARATLTTRQSLAGKARGPSGRAYATLGYQILAAAPAMGPAGRARTLGFTLIYRVAPARGPVGRALGAGFRQEAGGIARGPAGRALGVELTTMFSAAEARGPAGRAFGQMQMKQVALSGIARGPVGRALGVILTSKVALAGTARCTGRALPASLTQLARIQGTARSTGRALGATLHSDVALSGVARGPTGRAFAAPFVSELQLSGGTARGPAGRAWASFEPEARLYGTARGPSGRTLGVTLPTSLQLMGGVARSTGRALGAILETRPPLAGTARGPAGRAFASLITIPELRGTAIGPVGRALGARLDALAALGGTARGSAGIGGPVRLEQRVALRGTAMGSRRAFAALTPIGGTASLVGIAIGPAGRALGFLTVTGPRTFITTIFADVTVSRSSVADVTVTGSRFTDPEVLPEGP